MLDLDLATLAGLFVLCFLAAVSAVLIVSKIAGQGAKPVANFLANSSNETVFLFSDQFLVDATPPAILYIGTPCDRNLVWRALIGKLALSSPEIVQHMTDLSDYGHAFDLRVTADSDDLVISGKPEAGLLRITISKATESPDAAPIRPGTVAAMTDELTILREAVELSPAIAWKKAQNGDIIWATKSYLDLLASTTAEQDMPNGRLTDVFDRTAPPAPKHQGSVRRALSHHNGKADQWFEETSCLAADGGYLHFAIHADPLVKAENSLRNFVQTLTQTFAHLPIGLAIFDRDRQLALFNPALLDLTGLAPEWLSGRPTLYAFLDQLRENRHIPEPKNYKSWRDRVSALERGARDGTYDENWPLPDGRTYKVIGRPHPQGAVAFLFEDITDALGLQRQFRMEIEQGQSVLDVMPVAVAVFSSDRALVMSNAPYAKLWGGDPGQRLARLEFDDLLDVWEKQTEPSPLWQELRNRTAQPLATKHCFGTLAHVSGQIFQLDICPLTRGAMICLFTPIQTAGQNRQMASLQDA